MKKLTSLTLVLMLAICGFLWRLRVLHLQTVSRQLRSTESTVKAVNNILGRLRAKAEALFYVLSNSYFKAQGHAPKSELPLRNRAFPSPATVPTQAAER